ncbi:MAG: class I SAM-dependent methyltransferase [Thermodesulfobacteriota bacterium]
MQRVRKRAVETGLLEGRIRGNADYQKVDFIGWIFRNLEIQTGSHILELCCGTGAQTLPFLEAVGHSGSVTALDISQEAISKLKQKVEPRLKNRLTALVYPLDETEGALRERARQRSSYDVVFCSYGLYYSENPNLVLSQLFQWVSEKGSIVIVGPYGPNNHALFEFLARRRVKIPEYVRYTSQDFMEEVVVPFSVRNFAVCEINTMVNPVLWQSDAAVYDYWKNSTFYDEGRSPAIRRALKRFFAAKEVFVNEKWVMMVKMREKRIPGGGAH